MSDDRELAQHLGVSAEIAGRPADPVVTVTLQARVSQFRALTHTLNEVSEGSLVTSEMAENVLSFWWVLDDLFGHTE